MFDILHLIDCQLLTVDHINVIVNEMPIGIVYNEQVFMEILLYEALHVKIYFRGSVPYLERVKLYREHRFTDIYYLMAQIIF